MQQNRRNDPQKLENEIDIQSLQYLFRKKLGMLDLETCKSILDKYINIFNKIVINHNDGIKNELDGHSRIFIQMILSKAICLKKILSGIDISCGNDRFIIDPIVLITIIRNIYETVCMYELIYNLPKKQNQKEFIFLLYVIAGLKDRQRYVYDSSGENIKNKAQQEERCIDKYIREIKNGGLYTSLSSDSKRKIDKAIQKKEYHIAFDDNDEVLILKWTDIPKHIGIKLDQILDSYKYFSMYAHPTFISLMQFGQMFENEEYVKLSISFMQQSFLFMNKFLMDYMKLRTSTIETYDKLSESDKEIFEIHCKMISLDVK